MRISVVIPVFNVEKFLKRAVNSVLAQPEIAELILVEDGSTDNSLQLCYELAKTDPRIVVLLHPGNKNKGVAASRNLGIKNATSDFIAFLDADDYYLPGRFKQTRGCFENDTCIDGVYEMTGVKDTKGEITNYSAIASIDSKELFQNLQPIGAGVWFSNNGLTVRKTLFEKTGFFDETLQTSEDTLQWFKMAATGKLVAGNIIDPVSIAERRDNSLTADKNLVKEDLILMLYKLFRWCKKNNASTAKKELVLDRLFRMIYEKRDMTGFNSFFVKLKYFSKTLITDTGFILIDSKVSRKYAGTILGYNKLISFFKVKKSGMAVNDVQH